MRSVRLGDWSPFLAGVLTGMSHKKLIGYLVTLRGNLLIQVDYENGCLTGVSVHVCVLFSNSKTLNFADCEVVSMDENLLGKEAAVIANCDASYEVPAWKRCSAECLRKLLPNPTCYVFTRRSSLSQIDHGLARSDACTPLPADSGLCIFVV